MLAHSVFVLGALTGLRLDWKSPSREAAAVAWRDAMSRIGAARAAGAGPGAAVAGSARQPTWQRRTWRRCCCRCCWPCPSRCGAAACRPAGGCSAPGWLSVPEERLPPRALQRGAHKLGFDDLMPPAALSPAASGAEPSRPGRVGAGQRGAGSAGPAAAHRAVAGAAARVAGLRSGAAGARGRALQSVQVSIADSPRPARVRPYKPASTIDDDVRRRAYEAVAQRLGTENS